MYSKVSRDCATVVLKYHLVSEYARCNIVLISHRESQGAVIIILVILIVILQLQ